MCFILSMLMAVLTMIQADAGNKIAMVAGIVVTVAVILVGAILAAIESRLRRAP